jgi:CubicO group peptidase (beta-lactamase class C family)
MKKLCLLTLLCLNLFASQAQNLYFPPLIGNSWDTTSASSLGWCVQKADSLFTFLGETNTKSFMVLKDGKIVFEKYFDGFERDSFWYWASAGKTLTAMVVGIAQEQGFLNITDSSSKYLGRGWTSLSAAQEGKIKVWHQLTMTSGLDEGININKDCTADTCLQYKAEAGTRWAYHNAPYTLLDKVLSNATGKSYQQYFNEVIRNKTGINGLWLKMDYNNVFFSNTRSMARYGLLLLNRGKWDQTQILTDTAYFRAMTHTSQGLNAGYGYLTWLNGTSNFMLPGSQIVFPGMLAPDAPKDMYAALGKNGQLLMIVPSQKLVVVRMGNDPSDFGLVPVTYANEVWAYLKEVICEGSNGLQAQDFGSSIKLYPNPGSQYLQVELPAQLKEVELSLYDMNGRLVHGSKERNLGTENLQNGVYVLEVVWQGGRKKMLWVKK